MFVMPPVKPMPAYEYVFGNATWLYAVQQFSPMHQLQPHLLVKGVAVKGLVLRQAAYHWLMSAGVPAAIWSKSVRGSGLPFPLSFSLNTAVVLVPSRIWAILTRLR